MRRLLILSLLVLWGLTTAQEEGFYAPAPPADAAFVRLVYAGDEVKAAELSVGDADFGTLQYGNVSPYRVVRQGTRVVRVDDLSQDVEVVAGKFYTVLVLPGEGGPGISVLEDATSTNRAKALIALYNASSLPDTALKTADGRTEVLTGVEALAAKSVEVNAVAVDLAVFGGEGVLGSLPSLQLERGHVYSVVVMGTAEKPLVVWVESETVTE